MKKLLIALAAVFITAASYGQGQVVFANKVGTTVDAPVFLNSLSSGVGPGAGYSAQLFLQGAGNALTPLTPVQSFRPAGTGTAAIADRYWVTTPVDVPVAPGSSATFIVRAWQTSQGSFENATSKGESQPFSVVVGGGTLPPSNLVGLTSFVVTSVPEPSVIALGVLGASALLFRRRK